MHAHHFAQWAAAAFALPLAATAAPSSSVVLYGAIDLGYVHYTGTPATDDGAPRTAWGLASGLGAAPALGIRGSSELRPGLTLDFNAETGFCAVGVNQIGVDPDDPSQTYCSGGGFMQRTAVLGLSGRAGRFAAGRQVTLLASRQGDVDAFEDSYAGAVGNLSLVSTNRPGLGLSRISQSLSWQSPALRGFDVSAQYSFNVGSHGAASGADAPVPRAWLVDLRHQSGGILLGVSHAHYRHFRYALDDEQPSGDAGYRIWMAYLRAPLFGGWIGDALVQRNTADDSGGSETVWSIGLALPVGAARWMASVGQYASSMAQLPQQVGESRAWQYALGWRCDLSRRTQIHASYAFIRNAAADATHAGTALSPSPAGGVAGVDSHGFEVGISHHF